MRIETNVGLDGKLWFAVETRLRHEKKVSAALREKGIENFLPLILEKHQWSDRQSSVQMPLFPRYVFVRVEPGPSDRIPVLRTNGVMAFVGNRGLGTVIPDSQIENVQNVIAQDIPFGLCTFLDVGQRVRIRGGCMEGVEGILVAINGDRSLVVSVELIRRSLAVRITGFEVERVSPSPLTSCTTATMASSGS
jgi:transcription antitermination factor NusG